MTVFGLPAELPIWVDARVMERERIVARRRVAVMEGARRRPSILRRMPGVEVVDGLATDAACGLTRASRIVPRS